MNRFLEADYKPTETEVVVEYRSQPLQKDAFHESLDSLLESLYLSINSIGINPRVFDMNHDNFSFKIAFPEKLFEIGNLVQNLSVIAGNIFENPKMISLKIQQINWSKNIHRTFSGPVNIIKKIREYLNIHDRPLSSGLLLPKSPLTTKEYLEKAYLMWMGGFDIVEENEMMASVNSDFKERLEYLSQERKNCSARSKKTKIYIPNISAGTIQDIGHRARIAKDFGIRIVSINAAQTGIVALTSVIQTCRELNLILCANSSGQSMLTRNPNYGISSTVLASLYRLLGVDMIHVHSSSTELSAEINSLTGHLDDLNPSLPVCTEINQPREIENLVKKFGNDLILQGNVYVEKHPDGLKAGAEAFQYAIETASRGIDLDTALKKNEPLRRAINVNC